jgi:hypothetical protein
MPPTRCRFWLLTSPDCVFDASLVPKTCPNGFVDSGELNKQVSGESSPNKLQFTSFRSSVMLLALHEAKTSPTATQPRLAPYSRQARPHKGKHQCHQGLSMAGRNGPKDTRPREIRRVPATIPLSRKRESPPPRTIVGNSLSSLRSQGCLTREYKPPQRAKVG